MGKEEKLVKKNNVVWKVSVTDTFRSLPYGSKTTFRCEDLASYMSAYGTAHQLNKSSGYREFTVTSSDNGATYTVARHNRIPMEA